MGEAAERMRTRKQRVWRATWRLACLLAVASSQADAALGPSVCTDRYKDRLLSGPVPEDLTELLVATQLMSADEGLYYSANAQGLREFAERRIWLKALDEPTPRPASLREAIAERWPEDIDEFRRRGVERILQLQTLAVWSDTDSAPKFAAPADNDEPGAPSSAADASSRDAMLFARFRITNLGQEPVSALSLRFNGPQQPGNSGIEVKVCSWRPNDPLRPHESRDIACRFEVLRKELADWRGSIETRAAPAWIKNSSTIYNVSFWEQSRDVPYIPYNMTVPPVDPEIVRLASLQALSACADGPSGISESIFWWVVLPGVLGTALGLRSAR